MEFQERFSKEEYCEAFLFSWRWPNGFECPRCASDHCTKLRHRRHYQCRTGIFQVSITAGTAMHRTHLSLQTWVWATFVVARHKKRISATDLQHNLGIGSYRTAWALLHKIRTCSLERSEFMLKGLVEIDETIVGQRVDQ